MKLSKRAWLGIAVGATVVVVCALAFVLLRAPRVLAVGDRAPAFTLQEAGSGALSFRDDHHVTLINFWATWCPPCVMEAPSLEKFSRRVEPLGVRVIGVSVDQDHAKLEQFLSGYGVTYTILRDPDQTLAARFGTHKFPETYIFDRNGRLADKIIGATDWDDPQMIEFVQALVHWPPAASTVPAATSGGGNW
ncbi:MAG: TlpA family protein disulfide reductase [Terriglobia bacterium]